MELKGGEVIWSWQSWSLSQNIPSMRVDQQLLKPKTLSSQGEEVSAHQVKGDRCRCVCVCVCCGQVSHQ